MRSPSGFLRSGTEPSVIRPTTPHRSPGLGRRSSRRGAVATRERAPGAGRRSLSLPTAAQAATTATTNAWVRLRGQGGDCFPGDAMVCERGTARSVRPLPTETGGPGSRGGAGSAARRAAADRQAACGRCRRCRGARWRCVPGGETDPCRLANWIGPGRIPRSSTYSVPSNSRTSFGGEAGATRPAAGRRPATGQGALVGRARLRLTAPVQTAPHPLRVTRRSPPGLPGPACNLIWLRRLRTS